MAEIIKGSNTTQTMARDGHPISFPVDADLSGLEHPLGLTITAGLREEEYRSQREKLADEFLRQVDSGELNQDLGNLPTEEEIEGALERREKERIRRGPLGDDED